MHWDMEGASGLFTRAHAWYWEPGVPEHIKEEGRQLLMADINAAVAAALDAGANHVIICDTHHGGGNIRVAEMLQVVKLRAAGHAADYASALRALHEPRCARSTHPAARVFIRRAGAAPRPRARPAARRNRPSRGTDR